ncbi:hypothetical protein DHW03_16665 [Pedobacter yonginense]|uniref:Acyltransferase 3 domain-containing protein n=1 Tax=Pedobacter yonginense TaxID=651869 RepID=A0A317EKP1_9SPHI|nr:acyltransferase [Pedobacter yonginense]PWS26413.1 hypothetical protein DHW03_16665 [Pedobacter yonginense]
MTTPINPKNYIEGLNGIRALSAFLVISAHWPGYLLSLKFGWIGVNIFFVLSGFLITRILLQEKKDTSLKKYLANFYYKRSLRIFPLYYAFLGVFSVLIILSLNIPSLLNNETFKGGYNAVTKDMPYYLTYTYNLKINFRYLLDLGDSSNQFFGHLWSLAVEEQFYLIFPFVVYFASVKRLKHIIIGILIICPLIRLWSALYGIHVFEDRYWLGEFIYSNTFCQADALATGAALAVFNFKLVKPYLFLFSMILICLTVGIINLIALRKSGYFLVEGKSLGFNFPAFWFVQQTKYLFVNIRAFYSYTLINVLAVSLILPFVKNKPIFLKFFKFKFVDYLGKISYGIYIFHNPIIAFLIIALQSFGLNNLDEHPILQVFTFILYLFVVIGISHLSYQFFEKKILYLKHKQTPMLAS